MIDYRNPYTPGAGVMPRHLAGRDAECDNATLRLEAVCDGYYAQSVIYYGLRGVGKTALLNTIEEMAEHRNTLHKHLEIKEDSNFVPEILYACNTFVQQLSVKDKLKDKVGKIRSLLTAFSLTWNPNDRTFSLGLDSATQSPAVPASGELAYDLTELLVNLGLYAKDGNETICFFVDEIQYGKPHELEALVTALHRVNQLGLPILFFCAGLPAILKKLGDTKSYSERLFAFVEIDSLTEDAAKDAICIPAQALDVSYDASALQRIIEETHGYPYFIQELCSTIWHNHTEKHITEDVVNTYIPESNQKLDKSFFRVRYERCTPLQKNFLIAMVKCGELPCTIANVAKFMGRDSKSINPCRGELISKGLIYAAGHGSVDFTVPQFDAFLRRIHPDL